MTNIAKLKKADLRNMGYTTGTVKQNKGKLQAFLRRNNRNGRNFRNVQQLTTFRLNRRNAEIQSLRRRLRQKKRQKVVKQEEALKRLVRKRRERKLANLVFYTAKVQYKYTVSANEKEHTTTLYQRVAIPRNTTNVNQAISERLTAFTQRTGRLNLGRNDHGDVDLVSLRIVRNTVHRLEKVDLKDIILRGKSFQYGILEHVKERNIKTREGYCLFDYIFQKIKGKKGFKRFMTIDTLKAQFHEIGVDITAMTTNDLEKWITHFKHSISCYYFTPDFKLYDKFITEKRGSDYEKIVLMYVINNGHCYPIENQQLMTAVSNGCKDLSKYLTDFKWNIDYSNHKYYDKIHISIFKEKVEGKVYLVNEDFLELMKNCMLTTGLVVEKINFNSRSFVNPYNNCVIEECRDYYERSDAFHNLYSKFEYDNFKFRNQSYSSLGNSLFKFFNDIDELPKSCFNRMARNCLDEYAPQPMIRTLKDSQEQGKFRQTFGIDCRKSYTIAMYKYFKNEKLPLFTIGDNIELFNSGKEIQCGLYLLQRCKTKQGIIIPSAWYSHILVKKLIEKGVVDHTNIKYQYISRKTIDGNIFVNFVEKSYDTLGIYHEKALKYLINAFTGSLNKKYFSSDTGFITCSTDIANYYLMNDYDVDFAESLGVDYYFVRDKHRTRVNTDNSPLYYNVLSVGMLNLIETAEDYWQEDFTLIGYNTDALFIGTNKKTIPEQPQCEIDCLQDIIRSPVKISVDEFKPKELKDYNDKVEIEVELKEMKKINDDKIQSFALIGKPGNCKSWGTYCKVKDIEKQVAVSFQNSACADLAKKGYKNVMTINRLLGLDEKGNLMENSKKKATNFDLIVIDEFFQCPLKVMTELYYWLQTNPDIKVIVLGDDYQNGSIDAVKYKYNKCEFFKEMVNYSYVEDKPYELGKCRFKNKETIDFMNDLRHHRRVRKKYKFDGIDWNTDVHIVYTNRLRKKINKKYAKKYNNGVDDICVGNRIICRIRNDEAGLYKNKMFVVDEMKGNNVVYNGIEIDKKYFEHAFAITSHCYQGSEIDGIVNIHETDIMPFETFYTAFTRAKDIVNIRVAKNFYGKPRTEYHQKVVEHKFEKCRFADIYVIRSRSEASRYTDVIRSRSEASRYADEIFGYDEQLYVGYTESCIDKRLEEHKNDRNSKVSSMMNPSIRSICKVFGSLRDIMNFETYYINKYKVEFGGKVVNRKQLHKLMDVQVNFVDDKHELSERIQKFRVLEQKGFYKITYYEDGVRKVTKKRFNETNKTKVFQACQDYGYNLFSHY